MGENLKMVKINGDWKGFWLMKLKIGFKLFFCFVFFDFFRDDIDFLLCMLMFFFLCFDR